MLADGLPVIRNPRKAHYFYDADWGGFSRGFFDKGGYRNGCYEGRQVRESALRQVGIAVEYGRIRSRQMRICWERDSAGPGDGGYVTRLGDTARVTVQNLWNREFAFSFCPCEDDERFGFVGSEDGLFVPAERDYETMAGNWRTVSGSRMFRRELEKMAGRVFGMFREHFSDAMVEYFDRLLYEEADPACRVPVRAAGRPLE
jgi:hypothetical protein